jgi:hypothetical protein
VKNGTLILIIAGVILLGMSGAAAELEAKNPSRVPQDDGKDGVDLVRRANLPAALAWYPDFVAHGMSADVAHALCRWAGIESSGNPLANSKLGERGLLQCSKATALMAGGPYTQVEWDSLADKTTTRDTHARLAVQLYEWLKKRALGYVKDAPGGELDGVWYAKMMHQWPADFHGKASVSMHGPAADMARELGARWATGAPHSLHRLRAANVVAFGLPEPWGTT